MITLIGLFLLFCLIALTLYLYSKKIIVGIWSIKVFKTNKMLSVPPDQENFSEPTLEAGHVTDIPAEFIADPFILLNNSTYYMFFEVYDKSLDRGVIGLATSKNGEKWKYEKIVLTENFHLSYPYVFEYNGEFYMIPETSEINRVILYKAKSFPYKWEKTNELLHGNYVDSSIFQYEDKWWMLSGKNKTLHLFYSDHLDKGWKEHPKSPLITNNNKITRPSGRVIVYKNKIYRYTQDGEPNYGSAVRVFMIKQLTKNEYEEEELGLVLKGTNTNKDWRKDGMHSIDQIMIEENKWLVAVDGHKLVKKSYFFWKIDMLFSKLKAKF